MSGEGKTTICGSAKGFIHCFSSVLINWFLLFICTIKLVDTVANTVHATVDTTKNVAASAVKNSTAFIGDLLIFFNIYVIVLGNSETDVTVHYNVDASKNSEASAIRKETHIISAKSSYFHICANYHAIIPKYGLCIY